MKRLILLILSFISLNAVETINYNGNVINIKLSKDSWNRLIFDSEVNANPIFSKEKNLEIYKANNSVFIKFIPFVKVEVLDKQEQVKDIDYSKSKTSELFVSTLNGTYSFTIEPKNISSQTYFIQDNQKKDKNLLKFEVDPARKVIKNITRGIFLNEALENYKRVRNKEKDIQIDDLKVSSKFIFIGKVYSAYLYEITALKDTENIDEKIFLDLGLKNERAISLKDKTLFKNQKTLLVVVVGN